MKDSPLYTQIAFIVLMNIEDRSKVSSRQTRQAGLLRQLG